VHERHIARIAPAKFLALRSHSPVYREPLHHRTNLAFAHKYRTSTANIGYGMKGDSVGFVPWLCNMPESLSDLEKRLAEVAVEISAPLILIGA